MMVKNIILAPMEGVLDYPLRQIITSINSYDYCESEFIRVHDTVFPKKVFYREVPELRNNGGMTASGTPVWVQILGSQPEIMAGNAKVIADCGALGIDLNFGCPSRFVHRTCGGAAMLRTPKKMGEIIRRVRDVVPANIPISAKVRLGWEEIEEFENIFNEAVNNGIQRLVIHARTKKDAYKASAINWAAVAPMVESYLDKVAKDKSLPEIDMVINGEIKDIESAEKSLNDSKCSGLMLARYALSYPNLERVIRVGDALFTQKDTAILLLKYIELIETMLPDFYQKARVKQLMNYNRLVYPELHEPFKEICQQEDMRSIKNILENHIQKS